LYVCDAAIRDRLDDISEHKIGERVFGRPENYNSSEDNIVRSHARLLRQRLQSYFNSEGASEPLILNIPKGAYVPEFTERYPIAPNHLAEPQYSLGRDRRWTWVMVLVAILALVVPLTVLLIALKIKAPSPKSNSGQDLAPLWSQLFSSKVTTTIVVPDSTFFMLQEASHQAFDLQSYPKQPQELSENQGVQRLESLLGTFSRRRYTTFDALTTVIRILNISERYPSKVSVRYARDVTLRDLSPGNVVFIGRPVSNLWEQLFESKLNFHSYTDLEHRAQAWLNAKPQTGEQVEYVPKREGNRFNAYGSIAFIPNLSGGNVLLISGSNSASEEGLAEFVTDELMITNFAHKIGLVAGHLPYFDALLLTTTINEVSQEPSLVSYRVLGHP